VRCVVCRGVPLSSRSAGGKPSDSSPPWALPNAFTHTIHPQQAMEQQPFVDRHWLYYNPLRRDTVLEYFAQSRFYDRASCNEELRMQGAQVSQCVFVFVCVPS
jgi:hypothetical protein